MTGQGLKPRLPEGCGYSVRPLQSEDSLELFSLLETSSRASASCTAVSDAPSSEGVSRILEQFGHHLETDSVCVLSEEGSPIAAAMVFLPPASGDREVARLLGVVHPEYYDRGLGAALLSWMEERVRVAKDGDGALNSMRMSCDPEDSARVRLFEQHGFKPMRYRYKMQVRLNSPIQDITASSDLSIVLWDDTESEAARSAFNRAFKGRWVLPTIDAEMWMRRFIGVPQFRPDLSWLAMCESKVLGLCINWVDPDIGTAQPNQGWIEAIGVVPECRRRGVADAMMARTLNTFLEHGFTQVALDVDTDNPTGALHLYEKYGFAPIKREAIFVKVIDPVNQKSA